MVASLLRLIHSGPQDRRLYSGQPNISFFQKVFLRAGRFTTQWVRLDFNSTPNFGNTSTITIPRKGHLLTRLYLVSTMPDLATPQNLALIADSTYQPRFTWTNSTGHALVSGAELDIGGVRVEQLDGQLLEVLDEFNTPLEKVSVMNRLIGRSENGFPGNIFGDNNWSGTPDLSGILQQVITPLPFWFSRGDSGAALPVDAISVDEILIKIGFRSLNSMYFATQDIYNPNPAILTPDGNVEGSALPPILGAQFFGVNGYTGIQMPTTLSLGDTYILAEYVYLDSPEANRFRIADITLPVVQHYALNALDTQGTPQGKIQLLLPNPVRNLFFFAQPFLAPAYNAHFLCTRDLSDSLTPGSGTPWWPDASGLNPLVWSPLIPGFSTRQSEPLSWLSIIYEGRLVRISTANPALFRTIIPSLEQKKSPWVNRYYYNVPFGFGGFPGSIPTGEANMDKIIRRELLFGLIPNKNGTIQRYWVRAWGETYNILRIYGGRAGLMFGY